jgi:hypothetical protein
MHKVLLARFSEEKVDKGIGKVLKSKAAAALLSLLELVLLEFRVPCLHLFL